MYNPKAIYDDGIGKLRAVFVCFSCHKDIEVKGINKTDYIKRMKGESVQDAFPNMPIAERELFVSGTCGDCFKKLFPPMGEDEEDFEEEPENA